MAYLSQNDPKFRKDILSRKEYSENRDYVAADHENANLAKDLDIHQDENTQLEKQLNTKLILRPYQVFVERFMNPNTPFDCIYLKWQTGVGKTATAINLALNFAGIFRQMEDLGQKAGTIYVLGFTSGLFKKELFKFPEFGFVSASEKEELKKLYDLAESGSEEGKFRYINLRREITKRFGNRKGLGFFDFYGYKTLASLVFPQLPNQTPDVEFLKKFENSVIICDEIHQVYNTEEINVWGKAILALIQKVQIKKVVLLSATPMNNSPTEIVDLLNFLNKSREIKKDDIFELEKGRYKLKQNAHEKIKELINGRISYIIENDPRFYPTLQFIGETLPKVDYLKFIRCTMSPYQIATYRRALTVSKHFNLITDFAFPDPTNDKIGIIDSSEVRQKYSAASSKWLENHDIEIEKREGEIYFSGRFFSQKNLEKYSAKYAKILQLIISENAKDNGKMLIYHPYVHITGAALWRAILSENGFIEQHTQTSPNTRCSMCDKLQKEHNQKISHNFVPASFVIVTGESGTDITKPIESFNAINNSMGHNLKILIGSRVISEGYDFKGITTLVVANRPENFPSLVQVIGRARRKNSHIELSPELQYVNVYIFTACLENKALSYEEQKYVEKSEDFKIIQEIESILHESALDGFLLRNVQKKDTIYELEYTPESYAFNLNSLQTDTYNAYFMNDDIKECMYIIKRIFMQYEKVYAHDVLLKLVQKPPFDITKDPKFITEELFNLALEYLIFYMDDKYINISPEHKGDLADKLLDPEDKLITLADGTKNVITKVSNYFILFPYDKEKREILNLPEYPYREGDSRNALFSFTHSINVNSYVKYIQSETTFEERKMKFYRKFKNSPLEGLSDSICEYTMDFHMKLLEEIIEYSFEIWLGTKSKLSEYHEFYMKILYYYDLIGAVIFADALRDYMQKEYREYIDNTKVDLKAVATDEIVRMLEKTIEISPCRWCPDAQKKEYYTSLKLNEEYLKKPRHGKAPAKLLPVGHTIHQIPRFYLPKRGWFDAPEYIIYEKNMRENDVLIGYDQKRQNGIHVRFKIRKPIQHIGKNKDKRTIEYGALCITKTKAQLMEICRKLKIDLKIIKDFNVVDLCEEIRAKLIHNEIVERKRKSNIKWFYAFFEKQPEG